MMVLLLVVFQIYLYNQRSNEDIEDRFEITTLRSTTLYHRRYCEMVHYFRGYSYQYHNSKQPTASCLRTDLFSSSYYGGIQIGNWKSIAKYIFEDIIRHYSVSREKKKTKKRSESLRSYMKSFRWCMMNSSRQYVYYSCSIGLVEE